MTTTRDFNALLGSRICHDLISPLGAIGNGVELLTMSGSGHTPELALIAESVENATSLIRLYRIAFGTESENQGFGAAEIRNLLKDVYGRTRLDVTWQIDSDCNRSEVKLAFLVLLCCETSMPWGGRLTIQREGGRWTVQGSADRLSVSPDLWRLLTEPGADVDLTPAHVHYALAPYAAERLGRRLDVANEPGLLIVSY